MWGFLRTRTCLRYSESLLLHQPWKKNVAFSSFAAVDGRKDLLDLPEIEKVLTEIKADDVKVIPVPKHCDWADFMVLATGRSTWHVKNIAQALIYKAPHLRFFVIFSRFVDFRLKLRNSYRFVFLPTNVCLGD